MEIPFDIPEVSLRVPRAPSPHLEQLLIGFRRLARKKVLKLEVHAMSPAEVNAGMDLSAVLNGRWRILYDVKDGYNYYSGEKNVYREVMDKLLDDCDFYFKRSSRPSLNAALKTPKKILPLGLNLGYTVLTMRASIKFFIKRILRIEGGPSRPVDIESLPIFDPHPTVLFFTRMWDPEDIEDFPGGYNIAEIREQRTQINEMRGACIRACRDAFGPQFIGGLADSACARRQFPDCVITDPNITKRSRYLRLMKQSSICIASTGLHDSIGWKFAEYVAASKAIVTEPLLVEVPGPLEKGKNYLEFDTVDVCVDSVSRLLQDEELRYQMMRNNFEYYRSNLEPSQLVLNSLLTVLEGARELKKGNAREMALKT